MENRTGKIDITDLNILRVFAISIVVLRHSFAPYMGGMWGLNDIYESNYTAQIIGKYVSTISMPLFVFISGVLFSYLRNVLHKYPNYRILIQKKNKRLIRPYIILAPLYIFCFKNTSSYSEFFLNLWEGAGHLWFLLMIFTVFLIFYPLEAYFKKNIVKSFVFISVLYVAYPILHYYTSSAFILAFKYMPFFFVGYMFFFKSEKVLKILKNKMLVLFVLHAILFIIANVVSPYYLNGTRLNVVIFRLLFLPMGILSVSFIFMFFTKLKTIKANSLINNINKNSYYIYLLHQPILIILFKSEYLKNWNEISVILFSFTLVFLGSILLSNQIMKFKIGKKLIGAN